MVRHVIKRRGHEEHYDPQKIEMTCSRACSNAHILREEAQNICFNITQYVTEWVESENREISSQELFDLVADRLEQYNRDAAFMYRTHRDIS